MSTLLRNLLALHGGAIVAGVGMALIEPLGVLVYPWPVGLAPGDEAALRAFIRTLPAGAFLFIIAASLVGTFAGVFVTTRFSLRRPDRQGWLLGLVFLLSGVFNFLKYPHPPWVMAAALLAIPAATWLGVRLGRPRLSE